MGCPTLSTTDRRWITVGTFASVVVGIFYIATHPIPAQTAGIYLQAARGYAGQGMGNPYLIPLYTEDGLFFPYPPLGLILTGRLLSLEIHQLTVARFAPAIYTLAYIPIGYFLARELLPTPRAAGISTAALATCPAVFNHHLAAGGIVRAPAFVFLLLGLYTTIRSFRTHSLKLIPATGVLFGLTLLTHPVNALFFGISTLTFFGLFDRSRRGLFIGVAIAGLGMAISAVWWLPLLVDYGPTVFLSASGTRMWTRPPWSLAGLLVSYRTPVVPLWRAFAFAGILYAVARRQWILPVWLGATLLLTGLQRFVMLVGVLFAGLFVSEVLLTRIEERSEWPVQPTIIAVIGLLVIYGIGSSVVYASVGGLIAMSEFGTDSAYSSNIAELDTFDQYIGPSDVDAAAWIQKETSKNTTFVIAGQGYEWLPILTQRRVLVTKWGTEWTGNYEYYAELQERLKSCFRPQCINNVVNKTRPDYVYVQLPPETTFRPRNVLVSDLRTSGRYEVVYEKEAVVILEVTNESVSYLHRDDSPS